MTIRRYQIYGEGEIEDTIDGVTFSERALIEAVKARLNITETNLDVIILEEDEEEIE